MTVSRIIFEQHFLLRSQPFRCICDIFSAAGPCDLPPPAHFPDLPIAPPEKILGRSPEATCESPTGGSIQQEVDLQVTSTIQTLQQDMKKVMERLSDLESWAALQVCCSFRRRRHYFIYLSIRVPFKELSRQIK